jgi:hypothetical protein
MMTLTLSSRTYKKSLDKAGIRKKRTSSDIGLWLSYCKIAKVILKNPTQGIPGSMIHSKLSKNKNL